MTAAQIQRRGVVIAGGDVFNVLSVRICYKHMAAFAVQPAVPVPVKQMVDKAGFDLTIFLLFQTQLVARFGLTIRVHLGREQHSRSLRVKDDSAGAGSKVCYLCSFLVFGI